MIENLSKVLPQLALIAAFCSALGWILRGTFHKPTPAKSQPAADSGKQDRLKNLEAALEKSRASHKITRSELEVLQANSVPQAIHTASIAELEALRKEFDRVGKRISSLEADLRKSQETIKNLNTRANEVDKAQKDRRFALENELSKTREQLALLENRPDDSANLQVEIERLRESVATSTRFAGELRKRESAAIEALEKSEARLAAAGTVSPPAVARKIGPVADSGRIAAAKAEVLRLLEQNQQKAAAASALDAPENDLQAPVVDSNASAKDSSLYETTVDETAHPKEKNASVPGELFALD
jgi:chromosome segregation ATPase